MERLREALSLGGTLAFVDFRAGLDVYIHGKGDDSAYLRAVECVLAELRLQRLPPERVISAMEALNCRPTTRGESGHALGHRYTRALDVMLTAYYRAA